MESSPDKLNVSTVYIEEEMKNAYMDYAMSVIVGRALPDVRDGLKPVHRRILYAMYKEGLMHNKKYSKCAGVVGEVLKKYHPHGDTAVYDSLVRMAQEWNLRYPLIDGQGNFGSVDGDPAAAYRYTEARMDRIAEEMLADIEMETVPFSPNFDGSVDEPTVLPTKVPNLLINGSAGIAVGMATNIPPHNVAEVISGVIALIEQPDITIPELMQYIPGPDFPTAGFIHGREGIINAYTTGRGLIQMRAKAEIEETDNGRETIIITELPYQVNKARLVEKIAFLVKHKKIEGISDLRDESDRQGMRVVVELKRGEMGQVILNKLYKHTQMQDTFGVILLAIVNNQPKVFNLKEILLNFLQHRKIIVTNRIRFKLRKAEEKAHLLEGIKVAIDHIDEVISIIRSAKSPQEASAEMIEKYKLDLIQAKAILEMRLQRLTGMEREKVLNDLKELHESMTLYHTILNSEEEKLTIIKKELCDAKEQYGDERRTVILAKEREIGIEDLIAEEDVVVTISHSGYIKRNQLTSYKSQHRGGKGVIGMETREEDFVKEVFVASTHNYILFFTNRGKVHWLKVYEIPQASRIARGKAIVNMLQLQPDEKVAAYISVREFAEDMFLILATRKGIIKKTSLVAYSNPRVGGIKGVVIDEGDELIEAKLTNGNDNLFLATKNGYSILFDEKNVRSIGRVGRGVKGITLRKDDMVVAMAVVDDDSIILTVSEKGYGKRTRIDQYHKQGRGGKGVINLKVTEKNGTVVGIKRVEDGNELIIVTSEGQIIRVPINEISIIGRSTQGVKVIDLAGKDSVVSIATATDTGEKIDEAGEKTDESGEKTDESEEKTDESEEKTDELEEKTDESGEEEITGQE